ncbi:MAG: hypothetical protein IT518_02915 [Burkholderiales bacterium]|nr:hypothetical protein [Burkholderiales bacterium]
MSQAEAQVSAAAADGGEPAPGASSATLDALHRSARQLAFVLAVVCILSFSAGRAIVAQGLDLHYMLGVALIGMSGSGVGALTSLLARYAAGFELEDGSRVPAQAEGEVYNRRIAFCMLMRPVLGVLIAPLLVAAIAYFVKEHEQFKGSADAVTLVAFIGGLYAKSILETAKNAFKVVFRA